MTTQNQNVQQIQVHYPEMAAQSIEVAHVEPLIYAAQRAVAKTAQVVQVGEQVTDITPVDTSDGIKSQDEFQRFVDSPSHGQTKVEQMRAEIDASLPAWQHAKHLRDYSKNNGGRRPLPGALGNTKKLSTK